MSPELAALVGHKARNEKMNVRAECERIGVTTKTFYKYLARFEAEGVEGFYARSRRPRSSPTRIGLEVEDLIVLGRKELDGEGWDAGADSIRFWLLDHPDLWPAGLCADAVPSRVTINRILTRRGLVVPVPQRRPRASTRRFEADQPNHRWQMDGFEVELADGSTAVVLQLSDDCSRLDLALRAAASENGHDIWEAVAHAAQCYGLPREFLTDNGTAFSGRRRGWTSQLEENLHALGVRCITSSFSHPQTCGKNERSHQTVLKWLAKRPAARDLEQLQDRLDVYRDHYNHKRRKTHLGGLTPAERYALGPLDGPGDGPLPYPLFITSHKVSVNGCLRIDGHMVSVGLKHAGQAVRTFKQHRTVAVFNDIDLIAEFTLSAKRGYQRRNAVVSPKS